MFFVTGLLMRGLGWAAQSLTSTIANVDAAKTAPPAAQQDFKAAPVVSAPMPRAPLASAASWEEDEIDEDDDLFALSSMKKPAGKIIPPKKQSSSSSFEQDLDYFGSTSFSSAPTASTDQREMNLTYDEPTRAPPPAAAIRSTPGTRPIAMSAAAAAPKPSSAPPVMANKAPPSSAALSAPSAPSQQSDVDFFDSILTEPVKKTSTLTNPTNGPPPQRVRRQQVNKGV